MGGRLPRRALRKTRVERGSAQAPFVQSLVEFLYRRGGSGWDDLASRLTAWQGRPHSVM
jgi:hypothetical protein